MYPTLLFSTSIQPRKINQCTYIKPLRTVILLLWFKRIRCYPAHVRSAQRHKLWCHYSPLVGLLQKLVRSFFWVPNGSGHRDSFLHGKHCKQVVLSTKSAARDCQNILKLCISYNYLIRDHNPSLARMRNSSVPSTTSSYDPPTH